MKQLVIISGKGGTGKTVVSASFAALSQNTVMADCDVDASNLHLLLHPEIQETHSFYGGKKARLLPDECTCCGECLEVCRFDAIHRTDEGQIAIDPLSCEGCAACAYTCPVEAITMQDSLSGHWYVSQTSYGPFVHARLGVGAENSGKLVTEVRKAAKKIAEEEDSDVVIIDGPPGIGCPVIASLTGADQALIVTEPSPSGIHDMKRIHQLTNHFNIFACCCVNKFDINLKNTSEIETWCQRNSVPLIGKIPYDEAVIDSVTQGLPHVQFVKNGAAREIKALWQNLFELLTKEES
jgi:MinD superfamily P-loop ATPase